MVTLRQLECFVAVAEHESFTRAAEHLGVTQPALSQQVRALEASVGGDLLERLPREVRLTPMGRAMIPFARATLAESARAITAARQAAGHDGREIHLATVHSISLGPLPLALGSWRKDNPDMVVELHEHHRTIALEESMTAGQADVAIGPVPRHWPGPVIDLGEEEFVVLLPPGDAAAGAVRGGTLPLTALADREWVQCEPRDELSEVVDAACASAEFRPHTAIRTAQTATLPCLVSAGLGPALVPAHIVPENFDGIAVRPGTPVRRRLVAYARHEPDPVLASLIDTVHERLRILPTHVADLLDKHDGTSTKTLPNELRKSS